MNFRYDPVAKSLHWLVVVLVAFQFGTKLIQPGTAGATESGLNAWHVALGPTILLLMLLRLAWRLTHTPPPPAPGVSRPMALAASLTHWAIYALLIAIPVLGWISLSYFGGRPTLLFAVPLPALTGADKASGGAWGEVHGLLAWALLALIALHIAAALYHLAARDDGVFARMMPGRPSA